VSATSKRGDLGDDRAREISRQLEERPFSRRLILVCPYTPNIWKLKNVARGLDQLAGWVAETLLPAVGARTARSVEPARTEMDGCSLGGLLSFEIFVRRPELFAACGGVQAALNEGQVPALASRLKAAIAVAGGKRGTSGARRLHIETSRNDPFCTSNLALSRELRRAGVAHEVSVLPGPHDQPWLREAGTLEMLLWHDRALASAENPQ
jgi:enterochelin esterase-like enzyme